MLLNEIFFKHVSNIVIPIYFYTLQLFT